MNLTTPACKNCKTAEHRPDYPAYQRGCRGCAIRELANGPLFHKSGLDGSLAAGYRKALAALFGDKWRAGHEEVKRAHERIRESRVLL